MNFERLSDTLDAKELSVYFEQFLTIYGDKPKTLPALKDLYELAYRQWDTYEPLSEELAKKITDYLNDAVSFSSFEIMDIILSIVENLSLKSVFDYIIEHKHLIQNPSIRTLVQEAESDYADIIGNPFGNI